jgi:branched-subunit amino acid aminotransferase/4-amino-4-deoxychorismate lyase
VPGYERANISLYGKGVFTTVAICNAEPFLWEKHWKRLADNTARLRLDISAHSERSVRDAVSEAVERNEIANGRARISFFDDSPAELWGGNGEKRISLLILVSERRQVPREFKLTTSPYRINTTSPLAAVKSCNYLEQLMAVEEAKARDYHEAIRLNERGEIASACMANVFWLKGERLFTPRLRTGCVAGTTREYILENLKCEEVEVGIDALRQADDIFLTSAGIGVVQAAEFDGRKLLCRDHPILKILPF